MPRAAPGNQENRSNTPRVETQADPRLDPPSTSEPRTAEANSSAFEPTQTERIQPKPQNKIVRKLPESTTNQTADANRSNARIDAPDVTEIAPDQENAEQPLNMLFASDESEMEEGRVEQTAQVIRTEVRGEIFMQLDMDRNGLITDREAVLAARSLQRAVFEARGTELSRMLLRVIDTNRNGQADKIELINEIARQRKKTPGLGASVAKAFAQLDTDQDEFISAAEFQEQIKQLGRRGKPLKPRVARLFERIDFDHDMRISVAESQMGAEVFANLLAIQVQP